MIANSKFMTRRSSISANHTSCSLCSTHRVALKNDMSDVIGKELDEGAGKREGEGESEKGQNKNLFRMH